MMLGRNLSVKAGQLQLQATYGEWAIVLDHLLAPRDQWYRRGGGQYAEWPARTRLRCRSRGARRPVWQAL